MKIQQLTTIAALACASLLLSSCGSSNTSSNPSAAVDIYVAGTDGTNAVYWKNGVETVVSQNASARAIAVSGSDVYVGGSTNTPNGPVATIWKNGTATTLPSTSLPPNIPGLPESEVNAIAVANGNVYAAGSDEINAILWTNGTPTPLLDGAYSGTAGNPPYTTYASSLVVSGSDVYVAGFAQKALQIAPNTYWDGNVAVYWKNGVPTDLSQVTNQGPNTMATSIAVSGGDVYVAGNIQSSLPQAVYWNNGAQTKLNVTPSFASFGTYESSIAVSGSNLYFAGGPVGHVQGYWAYGSWVPFTIPNMPIQMEQTEQTAMNGTDVYVAGGTQIDYGNWQATYWKNGVPTLLVPNTQSSFAYGIALVPQQQ